MELGARQIKRNGKNEPFFYGRNIISCYSGLRNDAKSYLALRKEADKYINFPIFPRKRARIIYCFPYLYTS